MSPDSESHECDPRLFHTPLGITRALESNLVFFGNSPIEVMRIDRHGVKVNPDIAVDEAAKAVLAAIDANIKHMVATAVQAEHKPLTEWQPIETAPKDELILVGPTKRMGICVAMNHSRDGWVTETCSEWVNIYTPTHWMPLPPEPSEAAHGIKENT